MGIAYGPTRWSRPAGLYKPWNGMEWKDKGLDTCYSAAYMSQTRDQQRFKSRKWQLIGMSQWCHSTLCGHPLPALMDNWTHGAASRHTITPISHTRPSLIAVATT